MNTPRSPSKTTSIRLLGRSLILACLCALPASPAMAAVPATPTTSTTPASTTPTTPGSQTGTPTHEESPKQKLSGTTLTALPHATVSDGTAPLRIRLSGAPAQGSPWPELKPRVAGSWSTVEDSEYFKPASTLEPCTTYELTVWANTTAVGHSPLGKRRTITFHVACPSITALQQGLTQLGYMGASFHSRYGARINVGKETRGQAAHRAYDPPHGRLAPDPSTAPPIEGGRLDTSTRGSLTVFQEDHGITPTEPESRTWAALLAALALDRHNPVPYTWVSVSESIPETLEVHRGSHIALSTPANTGVAGAETQTGLFPIYSRLTSTTMSGTNPDGSKYSDPGVPWVNYFNGGDAVHGFPRGSYGTPQSNGCVELPIETAHTVYEMLQTGDIVWVKS